MIVYEYRTESFPCLTVVAFSQSHVLGLYFRSLGIGQDRDEAMKLAKKLTDEGAATFNTANAKAMADYYTEDAKICLDSRGNDSDCSSRSTTARTEIEKGYADVFKKPETIRSKNTVEYAKLLAPDMLVIAGTFDVNTLQARLAQGALLPGARQARGQVADVQPENFFRSSQVINTSAITR